MSHFHRANNWIKVRDEEEGATVSDDQLKVLRSLLDSSLVEKEISLKEGMSGLNYLDH